MLRFAVLGFPIAHSRSPEIYAPMFRRAGIEAEFLRMPVKLGQESRIRELTSGLDGFALTMPLKTAAIPYLDRLDGAAAECGAVNIVEKREGLLIGHNTDGDGAVDALRERGFEPRNSTAAILGRGGAARAVRAALERNGCECVFIVRDKRNDGEVTAEEILLGSARVRVDLFVNAAPLGMEAGESFAYYDVIDRIGAETVFDLVYRRDGETPLVASARAGGMKAIGGEELLYHQALRAFRIWTGVEL